MHSLCIILGYWRGSILYWDDEKIASHHWLYGTTTGINHLSLEFLPSVCHNVKVSKVQVDVVEFLTTCCGHVPHHNKGLILQDWTCCSQRGLESISMGGVLWKGGTREGREGKKKEEGEREVRHHHGSSPTNVSFQRGKGWPINIY